MSEVAMIVKPIRFAEFKDDLLWIEALPAKTWHTMMWGEVIITTDKLDRMVRNLKNNVRGQEVATDFEHKMDKAKGAKASGWIRDAEIRDNALYVGIEPTSTAKQEIIDKEWKYFSLEWEDYWQHPETQQLHQDVIVGGALTNVPVAKGLMPINFSELYDEKEGGTLTDEDKTVKDEHAAEEHQEPGEDNPDPDTNRGDDAKPDRHETLPADSDKTDEEGRPVTDTKVEDDEVELDKKLREKLGLAADADIVKAVSDLQEEVGPLREVAKQFSEKKAFSEAFPAQARELDELRKSRIEGEAIKFSETVSEMRFGPEGKHQFSQVVLEKVANTHKKFSEGTAQLSDFEEVLKSLGEDKALVEISERGTRLEDESIKFKESDNPRMAFSEAVKSIIEEDKVDYETAVKLAAEKHPELAEAYLKSTVRA